MMRLRIPSEFALYEQYSCIDPDFDEEWGWGECVLLAHEVETTGTIPLHPDGDRMSADYDPVPLHTRVYCDGTVAELKKREWARHLEDVKRWAQEEAEREQRERARFEELSSVETRTVEPTQKSKKPEPESEPRARSIYHLTRHYRVERSHPHFDLLVEMKLHKPIAPGQGRVFNDYVMINEADLAKWDADRTRRSLSEVWRGHTFVIFRLRY